MRLRVYYILQGDGTQGVVKFVGLADARRSDHIYGLGYRAWVHRALWSSSSRSTHAEQEWLWRWGETTRLVWTKSVLTCQDYREAPARSRRLCTQARRWHTEGDIARDGISTDVYCTERRTMSVNVALSKPLHFQEPAPGGGRCNCIVALGERRCRRGVA